MTGHHAPPHLPVLLAQAIGTLAPRAGGLYVDGTVGAGGHAEAILEASSPDGKLLGLDRDQDALDLARSRLQRFGDRVRLVRAPASTMGEFLAGREADGVLLDLGVSSMQLDQPERGFSFQALGPLDMRMDRGQELTADHVVNGWDEADLARAVRRLGEEPGARRVARAVVAARPITDTLHLARVVEQALGGRRGRRIHPATKTFQAIRMVVNGELDEVERAVRRGLSCVARGGRLVVISFHSLEDKLVKRITQEAAGVGAPRDPYGHPVNPPRFRRLRTKAVKGSEDPNPRARSARLRAVEREPGQRTAGGPPHGTEERR